MERYSDWEDRLRAYLVANRNCPFRWGSFDCCLFACNVVREITGTDMATPWRGSYRTKTGAWRITGGSLEAFVEKTAKKFDLKEIKPKDSIFGDVIFTKLGGGSLGVIGFEGLPAFANLRGIGLQPRSSIYRAWKVG